MINTKARCTLCDKEIRRVLLKARYTLVDKNRSINYLWIPSKEYVRDQRRMYTNESRNGYATIYIYSDEPNYSSTRDDHTGQLKSTGHNISKKATNQDNDL